MPNLLLVAAAAAAFAAAPQPSKKPVDLDLAQLFVADGASTRLSPQTEELAGHRVRAVGFMVRMEEPSPAAFYLARRPAQADESGGGTGDLPLGALRVEVPWLHGDVPWVEGPVEVVGTLEVGRVEDALGRVSWIRIVMEEPPAKRKPARRSPSRARDGVTPQSRGESK
ncbi:MAG TPA: hypothetical protein VLT82_19745 [Myxococcaceae bacterium]|nr:hypothetical protein [Myxococcaceae bacterium]